MNLFETQYNTIYKTYYNNLMNRSIIKKCINDANSLLKKVSETDILYIKIERLIVEMKQQLNFMSQIAGH